MANNVVRILVAVKDEVSSEIDKIRDKFTMLSKTDLGKVFMQGLGQGAFRAVKGAAQDALTAVTDFVTGSVSKASDLNETISKSAVIFGDSAAEIEAWGGQMAKSAGLSEKAALDAASGFAGLFKTVGIGTKDVTTYSKTLTELGSDLASFFNTDVDTALQALKSGLNGESEPLRKFNVFLSETAVTAKLAEMGIHKVGGQ